MDVDLRHFSPDPQACRLASGTGTTPGRHPPTCARAPALALTRAVGTVSELSGTAADAAAYRLSNSNCVVVGPPKTCVAPCLLRSSFFRCCQHAA